MKKPINAEPIDLIKQFFDRKREYMTTLSATYSLVKDYPNDKFKIGDKILFMAGFYDHLEYLSEVIGFDDELGIYVLWDCYWVPIYDNEIRNIKIIT